MGRVRPVTSAVIGCVLVLAGLHASSAGAANSTIYEDERGEESGAPDIQRVLVANDDSGRVTFRIEIPTHPTLTQDVRLRIWFSDGHPATGLTENGADGFVLVDGFLLEFGTAALYRCQDAVCIPTGYSTDGSLDFSYASGMTVTTGVGALGVRMDVSPHLSFSVEAGAGFAYDPVTRMFDFTNVRRDFAPSTPGSQWRYTVRVRPSALVARDLTTTPRAARAGMNLTVRLHVVAAETGETVTRGAVRCSARVGSSSLRATASRFVRQRATCVFRIPARATGKTLRGSISVSHAGRTVSRAFTRRIR